MATFGFGASKIKQSRGSEEFSAFDEGNEDKDAVKRILDEDIDSNNVYMVWSYHPFSVSNTRYKSNFTQYDINEILSSACMRLMPLNEPIETDRVIGIHNGYTLVKEGDCCMILKEKGHKRELWVCQWNGIFIYDDRLTFHIGSEILASSCVKLLANKHKKAIYLKIEELGYFLLYIGKDYKLIILGDKSKISRLGGVFVKDKYDGEFINPPYYDTIVDYGAGDIDGEEEK